MFRKVSFLLTLIFLFVFTAPMMAQGPEGAPTPEATVGASPTAVIVAPVDVGTLPETSLTARFMRFADGLLDTVQKLIAGFFALVVAVLGAAAYFLGRQNVTVKDAIEKLYLSMPPQAQMVIREGVLAAQSINKFADEVTDKKPNVSYSPAESLASPPSAAAHEAGKVG